MILLKILLWILIAIVVLLLLLCLVNVRITVGNGDSFYYKLHISGIRIMPEWFTRLKFGHKKDKKTKKSDKKPKKKDTGKTAEPVPQKKSLGQVLSLIYSIAQTAADVLPRGFRIRLKFLNITAGGNDAEDAAVMYGKIYAVMSGLFALMDGYKGFLYGFYAKRNKVSINVDYLSGKTSAQFEMTISFFIWQLLFSGIRIGISLITEIIKNSAQNEDNESSDGGGDNKKDPAKNTGTDK